MGRPADHERQRSAAGARRRSRTAERGTTSREDEAAYASSSARTVADAATSTGSNTGATGGA
jgi:hypothetical protein